jgi:multidrug efflux pump subunit AcrB
MMRARVAIPLIVLSLAAAVIVLALAVTVVLVRLRAAPQDPPRLTLEAVYPGATASVAEAALAVPLEEQINGVEHLRRLHSRYGRDGSYRLEVSFAPGTEIDLAQQLVQNRAGLALRALPAQTQGLGLTVRKPSRGLLMLICLTSRDSSVDAVFLNNYANVVLKRELARVPGVAQVSVLGAEDFGVRVWLDVDKLAARGLTVSDVMRALDSQDRMAVDGGPNPLDELAPIVISAGRDGRVDRLRDVSRVDLGGGRPACASLGGKPVGVLAVYPFDPSPPREVSARLRATLAKFRDELPPGIEASTDFDFAQPETAETPGFLLLDVDPSEGMPADGIARLLSRGSQALSGLAGVRHVLALEEQPFDRERDQPCVVACLGPAKDAAVDREQLIGEIRALFPRGEEKSPLIRIRDLAGAAGSLRFGYPIHCAIVGPDHARAQTLAGQLVARLAEDRRLIDLSSGPRLVSGPSVEIDQAKAAALGVSPAEISASIQPVFGPARAGSLRCFGRDLSIWVEVEPGQGRNSDAFGRLQVRNDKGLMVPVSALASLRQDRVPNRLERIDLFPAVSITASLAGAFSLAEARFVCERRADEVLSKERASAYRLTWLRAMPAARPPADR